ncbi:pyridoxamine 5'-phosphate oxidase [Qipengyuania spongiae]|uniref:Pyridoxine/pyridoxamine 5'-phosphate oxidase n=1 Tax=Qipengyuania spongiae TaxID=2909673 RepID=A0ABY5SZV1_9SPHN|nr:pyridoxamine 5'-phosphate oxidase [Qipengyuania spongiae]UVI40048.1 pyridoxamine 5'-phosphate oxidase [Qipengyuania spongiae]
MDDQHSAVPATDPFALFDAWFAEAKESEPNDPNAMALATAEKDGAPSVRMVLLKDHGPNEREGGGAGGGFVFYTNAESRKGREIRANMQAALLFHWKSLRRQIRIEGPLEEVGAQQADAYFHSRARASQIASAASDQSRPLADRADYLARIEALEEEYPEGDIPRPPHWTGFRLIPRRIEFWLDRPGRAHDRRLFTRDGAGGGWSDTLLYP